MAESDSDEGQEETPEPEKRSPDVPEPYPSGDEPYEDRIRQFRDPRTGRYVINPGCAR